MIKLIGACMTLAACGSMGFTWGVLYEKRPRQLISVDSALQLLETEILYGATPLKEAMLSVAQKSDPQIAGIFEKTALELNKMQGTTAGEAWNKAIAEVAPGTALDKRDIEIIKRLGNSLGVSDREDQAKHLDLVKTQLKLAVTQAELAAQKNSRVFKYLGFLGGLLLVLILY